MQTEAWMVTGKRYQVFSIKETKDKEGHINTAWVKAGSAYVNRDGSLNVYLDVLPLDGKLHVREAVEKRDEAGQAKTSTGNGSLSFGAQTGDSMGGH
jgi:hypothetical protein